MDENAEYYEVNFDGLIGPTHNFSGLSYGNIASEENKACISNPKLGALQGLEKMKTLHDYGIKQALFPPHQRPYVSFLRSIGFCGKDYEIADKCFHENRELFKACCSASSMWTANALTSTPAADTNDGKVHITAANLSHGFHRHIESNATAKMLLRIFPDECYFKQHQPLAGAAFFADEGSANHMHFCQRKGQKGVHVFCWGRQSFTETNKKPRRYPARQTLEASQSIARLHGIAADKTIFVQQSPLAIDAGVFHNDVISTNNDNVFLYHEDAFVATSCMVEQLQRRLGEAGGKLVPIKISNHMIPLELAVKTYLFNSQIVTLPKGGMLLLAPLECQRSAAVHDILTQMLNDTNNPINAIEYIDLRQSMRNGGGPACLRTRIVLSKQALEKVLPSIMMTNELYQALKEWINKHYRDRLCLEDFIDPEFIEESKYALDELTKIIQMDRLYDFQQNE